MTSSPEIDIRVADWHQDGATLRHIREVVFIEEQQVPADEEMDEWDEQATHFLLLANQQPAATGRLLRSGQIGRMAVLKPYRGLGLGGKILQFIVDHALANGFPTPYLHAQCHALDFYQRFGFVASGEVFMDAGIPHRHMDYKTR